MPKQKMFHVKHFCVGIIICDKKREYLNNIKKAENPDISQGIPRDEKRRIC